MYCLAFPATLKKAARMWYSSIRSSTIDSFSELEKLFILHFRTCHKTPRNTDMLFLLHQNEGESLWDYISRFNAATLEIPDLNEHVAMSALKKGLRTSRLTILLDKKFPKSYAELLLRAQKYTNAEEQAANRWLTEGKPPSKKKNNRGQGPPTPNNNNNNKYTDRRRSPRSRALGVETRLLYPPQPPSRKDPLGDRKKTISNDHISWRHPLLQGTGTNITDSTGTTAIIPKNASSWEMQ